MIDVTVLEKDTRQINLLVQNSHKLQIKLVNVPFENFCRLGLKTLISTILCKVLCTYTYTIEEVIKYIVRATTY